MDFKKVANYALSNSLTDGKTQITTDELIEQIKTLPNHQLDIIAFDLAESKDGAIFSILVFKQLPHFYYFGGKVLTNIVQSWISEMEYPNNREASKALESQGGCPITLEKAVTKSGNEFVKVTILA